MIPYLIILIVVLVVLALVVFRKKVSIINAGSLTSAQKKLLDGHVDFYHRLDRKGRKRFEQMGAVFLADTRVEGVGTEITELDRFLIASSAGIPRWGVTEWRYQN